jgi:hypothetical protein
MPGLVPGTAFFVPLGSAWMAGTSPAMTLWGFSASSSLVKCDRLG